MKILHVIDSGGIFGAENVLLSLVGQQVLNGLYPIIGSINSSEIIHKALEIEASSRDFKVKKFVMKPGLNLLGAYKILKYAKENKIDIIHSHGYKSNILLGLQPWFYRKIPIISTMHGWTSTHLFSKMRLNQEFDAFALRHVDKIVLVSRGMLSNKKINKLPMNKLHIIENGVEINYRDFTTIDKNSIYDNHIHDNELKTKLKSFCTNSIIIGSIGRLSREKGFEYLVEAIYLLRKKKLEYNTKLLIIGDGNQKDHLSQLVEKYNLSDQVLFTGYIKNAFNLLPLFDIFSISSITEGLPITLLEAMQYCIPIVSTNVGGIPFAVDNEKSALLVEPKNPSELSHAFERIINNRAFGIDLAKKSKEIFLEKYSSKAMANQYYSLYQEIVSNK